MPKVKICGITNQNDMLMCDKLGADFLGFIFVKESPRLLSDMSILKIKTSAEKVAVVKNPLLKDIENFAEFRFIQFHGFESLDTIRKAKELGLKIIKTIFPNDTESLRLCEKLSDLVDFFLVDSSSKMHGVESTIFSAESLDKIIKDNKIFGRAFFLSGGLTPQNVGEFIRRYNPYGVDVASGVEEGQGKKSREKVEEFIKISKAGEFAKIYNDLQGLEEG